MKETGILYSTDMVRAILEGRKTMTRRVISPATSIVGVGRVDWSNFCWDGSETFDFGDSRYSTESEYVPDELKGQLIGIRSAPLPFVDGSLEKYQYLHAPYRWADDATVFRIYPKWDVGDRLWVRETFMWAKGADGREGYLGTNLEPLLGAPPHYAYRATEPEFGGRYFKWRPSIHMPRHASRITQEITGLRAERLQDITSLDAVNEGCPKYHEYNDKWECIKTIPPVERFHILWDSLNAKRGYTWESNPWVWPISFKEIVKEA